jgi:hypothetical protein
MLLGLVERAGYGMGVAGGTAASSDGTSGGADGRAAVASEPVDLDVSGPDGAAPDGAARERPRRTRRASGAASAPEPVPDGRDES